MPGEPGNMFADAVKQASPFAGYSNTQAAVPLDANGWPMSDATLPLWSNGLELNGAYQVSFNGQAQLVDWAGLGQFSAGGVTYGTVLPAGTGYDAASNTTSA